MMKLKSLRYTFFGLMLGLLPSVFYAEAAPGIDKLFENVTASLGSVAGAIISISVIAGLAFGVVAIFKFKQHKDNPNQIPLGQPMALLGIAVMLLWLPFLLRSLGSTISGGNEGTGSKSVINKSAPSWVITN